MGAPLRDVRALRGYNVDVIASVDAFRFNDVPDVVYLHFAYSDTNAVPDATVLDIVAVADDAADGERQADAATAP